MKKCLQGLLVDATTLLFSALKVINRVRDETSSGGLLANDCLVHYSVSSLPFGGVGEYFHRQDSAFLLSLNGDVSVEDGPCVRNTVCTCACGSYNSL